MSAAQKIAQACQTTIHHGEKLAWKIRQIDTMMVLEAGGNFLLAARPQGEAPAATTKARQQGHAFMTTVAAAGVTHVSVDGGETWESCRIVSKKEEENLAENAIHETSLPPGTVIQLGTEILKLSTDGGAAASRLDSFL